MNDTIIKSNIVTKAHFDRAVKQRWSTATCLIAQLARDNGDIVLFNGDRAIRVDETGQYIAPYANPEARHLMSQFDMLFRSPGDELASELQELRNSLPIQI